MSIVLKILIVIGTFIFMEGVAWFTHKYIMHGFLWNLHKSHHKVHKHFFEMNDLFAVMFSIPSILLIYLGYSYESYSILKYFGIGIFLYGVAYIIFHDVIVHRRIKINFKSNNEYMRRIMNAHYVHHKVHSKDGAKAFGFLFAPKKYDIKKD